LTIQTIQFSNKLHFLNQLFEKMIPRQIIKKIRQIEIRTNRLVTESLADFLFQPTVQFRRISGVVPNSQNFNFAVLFVDRKINRVRPGRRHFGLMRQRCRQLKSFGALRKSMQHFTDGDIESVSNLRFALIIKGCGFLPVAFSVGLNDNGERHFLVRNGRVRQFVPG
jgi:hypothetical protein